MSLAQENLNALRRREAPPIAPDDLLGLLAKCGTAFLFGAAFGRGLGVTWGLVAGVAVYGVVVAAREGELSRYSRFL